MRLRPVPVQIGPGSSDVVAYITDGGLSIIRSTDDVPGEGRLLHVSVSHRDRDPTGLEILTIARHFMGKKKWTVSPTIRYAHTFHIYEEQRLTLEKACSRLIEAGVCHADCCGVLPVSPEFWEKWRFRAQVPVDRIVRVKGFMFIHTSDLRCVFLDRESFKCVIYPARPKICRVYGHLEDLPCPYLRADGTERSEEEIAEVKRRVGVQMALHLKEAIEDCDSEIELEQLRYNSRPVGSKLWERG